MIFVIWYLFGVIAGFIIGGIEDLEFADIICLLIFSIFGPLLFILIISDIIKNKEK